MRIHVSTLIRLACGAVLVMVLANILGSGLWVNAAGSVGTGTPDSCNEAALVAALSGGGAITFNCGPNPVIINITKEITVTAVVSIDGGGLVSIGGRFRTRIFHVSAGASLTLNRIRIGDGAANPAVNSGSGGNGAAILNDGGTVSVTDSTIASNRAAEDGAAIFNKSGTMSLIRTLLAINTAGNNGGAIAIEQGALSIGNTTISGNFASNGGGAIFNKAGTLTITNSTIFDNNAALGASALMNSTGGQLTIKNSIVANKLLLGGLPIDDNCAGVADGGNNLQFPGESCGAGVKVADPLLAALADNGGYSETLALKAGSPAIDAGNDAMCNADPVIKIDERIVHRPVGASCDIGAFEFDPQHPGKNGGDTNGAPVPTLVQLAPPTAVPVKAPTLAPVQAACPGGKPLNQYGVCTCTDPSRLFGSNLSCGSPCPAGATRNGQNQCVNTSGACEGGQTKNNGGTCTCVPSVCSQYHAGYVCTPTGHCLPGEG